MCRGVNFYAPCISVFPVFLCSLFSVFVLFLCSLYLFCAFFEMRICGQISSEDPRGGLQHTAHTRQEENELRQKENVRQDKKKNMLDKTKRECKTTQKGKYVKTRHE